MGVPESNLGSVSNASLLPNGIVGLQAQFPVSSVRADGTIALPMSAARNIRIGGLDASQPLTGVGATPTVSWDAPAVGTPTAYQVQITSVTLLGTTTRLRILAKMFTKQLSLQIPDGFLSAGTTYVINIAAIDASGIDITAKPSQLELPFAASEVATAQLTP